MTIIEFVLDKAQNWRELLLAIIFFPFMAIDLEDERNQREYIDILEKFFRKRI